MEEKILQSIKLKSGISNNSDDLLLDIISDAIIEVKEYINLGDSED